MPSQVFIFITFETTKINVSFRQEEFYLLWWIWIQEMKEEQRTPRKRLSSGAEAAAWPELHFVWTDHNTANLPQNTTVSGYGSEGKLWRSNGFPIFPSRWCSSCLTVQRGGRLLEGIICLSRGSSTQRENRLFFSFFVCWSLNSTPWTFPPGDRWNGQANLCLFDVAYNPTSCSL